MIDIQSEEVISITVAAKRLPSRPHVATLYRHMQAEDGLEFVKIGGRRYTSVEALQRWVDRTTSRARGGEARPRTQNGRAHEAAMRRLRARGVITGSEGQ